MWSRTTRKSFVFFSSLAALALRSAPISAQDATRCSEGNEKCWTAHVSAMDDERTDTAQHRPTSAAKIIEPNVERNEIGPSWTPRVCASPPAATEEHPFQFSVDGKAVDGTGKAAGKRSNADSQRCTDVVLKQSDIQIRYDGLQAEPRLNVVAAPDAVLKGDMVVFKSHSNYELQIARAEIRLFADGDSVRQTPLAVVPIAKGGASWIAPRDAGALVRYVLRVYDAAGRFDETAPKVLDIAEVRGGKLKADDLTAVYDGNALSVRNIPTSSGAILVSGRDLAPGTTVKVMGVPVPVDAHGAFAVRQLVGSGPQQIEVAITDTAGKTTLFSRSATIPDHDFFYVALADLTAGKTVTAGQLVLLNPNNPNEFKDKSYVNGRLAFYLKGKISGDTLLTAAADTRDQPINQLFSNFDSKDPRYLLRNLDPNRYYPVYGDDSTLIEDAPTRGKFYVRLERGDSHIMWGNFKTTITGTEYVRYERGLYGARAQIKTEEQTVYGERRGQIEAFAAEPGTLGARDVYRSTGGSLYYMSRQNITQGSERVTVEIRDRNTGLVLQTVPLTVTQDYDVNYLQGRVVLKNALSSIGSNDFVVQSGSLSGNDQYLVINYEYAPGLQANTDKVFGGRASYWINDHVEAGVTGYDQSPASEKQTIGGADVTLRHKPGTYIKAEVARSTGLGSGEQYSADGGYTFSTRSTSGSAAYAKRVEAAADLAEIIHGAEGRVAAFWKDRARDFSGPGELAINGPARDMGIKSDVKIDQNWSEKTKLDSHQDQYRTYKSGEQNVTYSFDDYWRATLGARLDNNQAASPSASPYLNQNGSRTDVAIKVDYDSHHDWNTYAFGQVTAERSGQRDENNRFGVGGGLRLNALTKATAEISEGNGGLGGKVGIEYKVDEKRSSYINYGFDPDRTDIITRGGAGILTSGAKERFTDNLSVFGEERLRHGGGYSGLTHAFGLDYVPYEHWKTGLAFETGTLSEPVQGDVERTAVSPSVGYTREGLTYGGKFEYRHDHTVTVTQTSSRDTYLMNNSLTDKLSQDWRFAGRLNGSYSTSNQGSFYAGNYLEAVTGFAYRPIHDDKLNALFKYTFFYDLPSPGQSLNGTDANSYSQQSHVLSVDAAYDLNQWVTVGGKYAIRTGELRDNTIAGPWFSSTAQLFIGRVDLHIVAEWDVTGEVRSLDATTAENRKTGVLLAAYRHVGENFKVGVGYNFTNYTDDLTNLNANNRGIFVNAIGKF